MDKKKIELSVLLVVLLVFMALLMASCGSQRSAATRSSSEDCRIACETITIAINQGDWHTLRKLSKPGMRANDFITMWENSQRAGHPVRVGKQIGVEKDAQFAGQRCTKCTFELQYLDGTANSHQLQILLAEQAGRAEILDFWNFGW